MANTVRWVTPPSNPSVGSVLVYRSDNTLLESLGSRTIIATVGIKDTSGSWVGSYVDSAGVQDSLYRVQFYDGIGSSPLSDVIGREYSEQLASFDDVIREGRLQSFNLGSEDIYYAIQDASDTVYTIAGDPIKSSAIYLDSITGTSGQAYAFNGDWGPVYQVREVYTSLDREALVASTSYEIDYTNGHIKFTDAFLNANMGRNVIIHWVPKIYNLLVKSQAAKDLIEGEMIVNGKSNDSPLVKRLDDKIQRSLDAIKPVGIFSCKSKDFLRDYDVIAQPIYRDIYYFNK